MRVLMLFLDGIGLGDDDPSVNPFAAANLPTLSALAGGRKWLRDTPRTDTGRALFMPTDPRLGIPGRPQSATGQAAIITGRNVPQEIGEHYGPHPNPPIRAIIEEGNIFTRLVAAGKTAARLDAFPPSYFAAIDRGKRLRTALQHAGHVAGIPMRGADDLYAGRAFSADWTGEGWREVLGYPDAPVLSATEAGRRIAEVSRGYDFSLFSTWITDEIGHRGPLERGIAILERFDAVMAGLLEAWQDDDGLIVITSDHGNLEDVSIRQHTENDVPTVVIGAGRAAFGEEFRALTDLTPAILRAVNLTP